MIVSVNLFSIPANNQKTPENDLGAIGTDKFCPCAPTWRLKLKECAESTRRLAEYLLRFRLKPRGLWMKKREGHLDLETFLNTTELNPIVTLNFQMTMKIILMSQLFLFLAESVSVRSVSTQSWFRGLRSVRESIGPSVLFLSST